MHFLTRNQPGFSGYHPNVRKRQARRSSATPRFLVLGTTIGVLVAATGLWLTRPEPIPANYRAVELAVAGMH